MTRRHTFPDEGSRLVYGVSGTALAARATVQLKIFTDALAAIPADIQTTAGAAINEATLTVDASSLLPLFLGPDDGTDTLYARRADETGPISVVYARNDDRLDLIMNEGPRNPMAAEWGGAAGDGVTDDTAAFEILLASFGTRGGEIELPPRVFRLPDGITSSVPGLVVRGLGHRNLATGDVPGPHSYDEMGPQIKAETAGAWCWTVANAAGGTTNDYRGSALSGITFAGDAGTGGGLRVLTTGCSLQNLAAIDHKTGKGFWVDPDALGVVVADDASWGVLIGCMAVNCLTGFHINSGTEVISCFTLKSTAGGIGHTGTGFLLQGGNISVLGGKTEGDADGWLVTSTDGVFILGAKAENNTRGYYLNRPTLPGHGSRHRLIGCHASATNTTSFEIGPNQQNDILLGCSMASSPVDLGSNSVIWGDQANNFSLTNLTLRRAAGGQKAISLGIGTTETGALEPQNGGFDLDVAMVADGKIHARLGGAGTNAYFGVRDPSDNLLFRVFGNSQISHRKAGEAFDRISITDGVVTFGSGAIAGDTTLYRLGVDKLRTDDMLLASLGIGVGNSAAATTPGTVTRKIEVFDATGVSLGFVPVYNAIT